MMDFIYKLYSYDNFTLYLTIILVILIVLFVLVYIFGKKDQKLEETKKLKKIELEKKKEKFIATPENKKETDSSIIDNTPSLQKEDEDISVLSDSYEPTLEDTAFLQKLEQEIDDPSMYEQKSHSSIENKEFEPKESMPRKSPSVYENPPLSKEPPKMDVQEEMPLPKKANVTVFEPTKKEPVFKEDEIPDIPLRRQTRNMYQEVSDEDAPISVDELTKEFDALNKALEKDLSAIHNIKKEFGEIKLPEINHHEEELPTKENIEEKVKAFQPSRVFSSVYVNENASINPDIPQKKNIDTPVIKSSAVEDDDDFDLPTLKS